MRWFLSLEAAEPKWGCLSLEPSCRISRGVAHAHEEKASLERCDSSAEPALEFRTIKATRLSVANYNTTLSSDSLETGTGSSNSLRSAKESLRTNAVVALFRGLG
jgi:hypothetical protein